MPNIQTGDRVAFAAKFLRSIGDYSNERASMRGTVVDDRHYAPLVGIMWDGGDTMRLAHHTNLVRADRIHLEPV